MASEQRFGYEWDHYRDVSPQYEEQLKRWFGPLDSAFVRNKRVLDAGCGMGRNSYWCLRWGAEEVVAFDNDVRTVEAAKKTLAEFSNATVIQRSIYDIAYDKEFDFVFSIGVVHHLEHPQEAIRNFYRALKPGGTLLVWLYGHEGNENILKILDPLRIHITSRMSPALLHILTYGVSVPFWILLRAKIPRGPYYDLLRTFRFWHVHSIIFDQLLPTIARYYKKDEAIELLVAGGFERVGVTSVNQKSWTVIGTRPAL